MGKRIEYELFKTDKGERKKDFEDYEKEYLNRLENNNPDEITDNSSPETIPSWDSFNSYILLDELESEFKTEFTIDEVTETKNVSDIKKNLKIHGIILDD